MTPKRQNFAEWSENASLTKHMEFWQEAGEPDARGKLCKYLEGKSPRKARAGSRTLMCNTLSKIKEHLIKLLVLKRDTWEREQCKTGLMVDSA